MHSLFFCTVMQLFLACVILKYYWGSHDVDKEVCKGTVLTALSSGCLWQLAVVLLARKQGTVMCAKYQHKMILELRHY